MGNHKVKVQNLRNFTVQIRHAMTDAIVGTGFVVSASGQVVTCVHVVRDASEQGQIAEGVEVGVYFQPAKKAFRAVVAACFLQFDDDVVLLQLLDNSPFLLPPQMSVAILGAAEDSTGHRFRTYGYRSLDIYSGGLADGKILGEVEPPPGRKVQVDPIQLASSQINRGMSGAAVLDLKRDLVVGIISETFFPDESTKDRDTAWAVNARVLTFAPMILPVQDVILPDLPAPKMKRCVDEIESKAVSLPGISLNNAPAPLEEWVGRTELLNALNGDWVDRNCYITELIGFGGEGKSSLARRWLDNLLIDPSLPQPKGVFWWSFYEKSSVEEFFEVALIFMSGGLIDPLRLPSANVKAQVIQAMLQSGRYLFILDGLEVLQYQDGDDYGLLKTLELREFLYNFAVGEHESFCVITSRVPLIDLIDYTTYTHRDVERLSPDEGRSLLRNLGVIGTDADLDQVVKNWDGYALVLSLLASYLADHYNGKIEHLRDIPPPTADETRYVQVRRVLRRYDEHLTADEQEFLMAFSAFRLPVPKPSLQQVFHVIKTGFLTPLIPPKRK